VTEEIANHCLYQLVKDMGASDVNRCITWLSSIITVPLLWHHSWKHNFVRGRTLSQMYHKDLSLVILIFASWITYLTS